MLDVARHEPHSGLSKCIDGALASNSPTTAPTEGLTCSTSACDEIGFTSFDPALIDPTFQFFNDLWLLPLDEPEVPLQGDYLGLQMEPQEHNGSALAAAEELYSRSHTPAVEDESIEPREYRATAIEVDATLSFPDMESFSSAEIDREDLSHVQEVSEDVVSNVTSLANRMEINPHFPSFVKLKLPPTPVINAWVQLYFEHFHPISPILHQPTLSSKDTHWLLIFTVAAIGAKFSTLRGSMSCSRAMHELIRRQSSFLVSNPRRRPTYFS